MSSLKARRRVRTSIEPMRPLAHQLQSLRGSLIAKASQPDNNETRAELRALALATVFVIDACQSD